MGQLTTVEMKLGRMGSNCIHNKIKNSLLGQPVYSFTGASECLMFSNLNVTLDLSSFLTRECACAMNELLLWGRTSVSTSCKSYYVRSGYLLRYFRTIKMVLHEVSCYWSLVTHYAVKIRSLTIPGGHSPI